MCKLITKWSICLKLNKKTTNSEVLSPGDCALELDWAKQPEKGPMEIITDEDGYM